MRRFTIESWSPFEAFVMAGCVLAGASGLVPHDPRGVIDTLAPHLSLIWYLGLLVGGLLCLVTNFLRFPVAPLLERVAVLLLAGFSIAYGVGVIVLNTTTSVGGMVTLAFGAACAGRAWQITLRLARLRKLADEERAGGV